MTIGKITGSQQDFVYVKVRPEDGTAYETHDENATAEEQIEVLTGGQEFSSDQWFGRLIVPITAADCKLELTIWDSPAKILRYYQAENAGLNGDKTIHLAFDPLPPGDYYWELKLLAGTVKLTKKLDSTYMTTYLNGSQVSGYSWKSKIMLTPDLKERPIAVQGDEVDHGITATGDGIPWGTVNVGTVIGNINTIGDNLANGGEIRTGAWHVLIKK